MNTKDGTTYGYILSFQTPKMAYRIDTGILKSKLQIIKVVELFQLLKII